MAASPVTPAAGNGTGTPAPTPVLTPPAAPAATPPQSIDSHLDSLWDKMDAAGGTGDEGPAPTEPDVDETPTEEVPVGDQPAEGADAAAAPVADLPPETPDPLAEFETEIQPDKVSADGKQYFFRENKAKRLLQANKEWNEVQQAIPGANIETLKEYQRAQIAINEMHDDFRSGDPQQFKPWLDHWFDKAQPPHAVAAVIAKLPQVLQANHPAALRALENQVQSVLVKQLYMRASKMQPDPEGATDGPQAQAWALAQLLDQTLNGTFTKREEFISRQGNPVENQRRQLERDKQEFANARFQEDQTRRHQWLETVDSEIFQTQDSVITDVLKKAVPAYEGKPQWEMMVTALQTKIRQAAGANADWQREFDNERVRAFNDPSDQVRESLKTRMRNFAATVVRQHAKSIIDAVASSDMAKNAAIHDKSKAAQNRREAPPSGNAVPRASNASTALKDGKIKSQEEYFSMHGW